MPAVTMASGAMVTGTAPGGTRGRRDVDVLLLAGSAAGFVAVAALLVADAARGAPPRRGAEPPVARLAQAEPGVLRRPPGTLVWEAARAGDPLAARDTVYVPPAAWASVAFDRGANLDIEERSLVVIEPPEPDSGAARVTLAKGHLSGASQAGTMSVRTPGGLAVLEPGAEARVGARDASGPRVEVVKGRARTENGEVAMAAAGIRLDAPARNQRFWFARFPGSVLLRWDTAADAARLEVATDPDFASVVDRAPGKAGAHAFHPPAAGPYFWRLVDRSGLPASEVRRLVAAEDRPPTTFSPMAAEIVLAPQGVQVPFWWTAVEGASRYHLEISADASFASVAFSADTEGPGMWAALDLREGVYYWRVRAREAERGDSPSSAPSPFRLIRRPLPEAPLLFDPSIEVDRGAAR